jgi:hypothetical protein
MAVDDVARSIDRLEVMPQAERTDVEHEGYPFSPPWQISNLEKPDQPKATELDARPVEGLQAGADDYLIKRFDKNELLARITGRITHSRVIFCLGRGVRELEKAVGEIDDLKLRFPL